MNDNIDTDLDAPEFGNHKAYTLRRRLGLMNQFELAAMLDVTIETLREWRRLKQGPDFVKTGKSVMYREADVQDWVKRNVVPVVRA